MTLDEHLQRPCGICGRGRGQHIGRALGCPQGYGTSWSPDGKPDPRVYRSDVSVSATPRYYIRNKYVGNCALWWRADRCGYTADLQQAGLYSQREAEGICRDRPDQDFMHEEGKIRNALEWHVDVNLLFEDEERQEREHRQRRAGLAAVQSAAKPQESRKGAQGDT